MRRSELVPMIAAALACATMLIGCEVESGPDRAPAVDAGTLDNGNGDEASGQMGDSCTCPDDANLCQGTHVDCDPELWCLGTATIDAWTCTEECETRDDCPDGFACTTMIIDTIDFGDWCMPE
jgi:hypothetical protein